MLLGSVSSLHTEVIGAVPVVHEDRKYTTESRSVEKYLAASATARKPPDRSISSYATPEAPPARWQARRISPKASPIASCSSWTRAFSIL